MVEGFDRYTTIDDLLKDVDVIGYLLKRDVLFKTNIKKIRGLRKIESYKHAIIEGEVFVGNNVVIQPYTYIIGPVCLMDDVCIGPGSFIRHNTFIGEGSYIGYGNEISNSIVLPDCVISHHTTISKSFVGAGTRMSTHSSLMSAMLKPSFVTAAFRNKEIFPDLITPASISEISQIDFGSIIGDRCVIGAYASVNPGSVMENDVIVYPGVKLPTGRYRKKTLVYIENYKSRLRSENYG